jgi:hypothetical protein
MNLTAWLDVAIGLMLIFLGASLLVTGINEWVAQMQNLRGKELCKTLLRLIDDPETRAKLRKVPALEPFFGGVKSLSYVDPNLLARMLVGTLGDPAVPARTMQDITAAIDKLPPSGLRDQLQAIARTTDDKVDDLINAVSSWTDRSLTMLGEVYKKKLQWISLGIGMVVAGLFNLDTITLTEHLYRDKDAREATVALAVHITAKTDSATFDKCLRLTSASRKDDPTCAPVAGLVDAVRSRNESLGKLPIGWSATTPMGLRAWFLRVLGWILTGLAISVGAPFWFDLLNKFVNVRHGMRRPEVSPVG